MPEQLLHGADVVAALEQMRRKRVPQRVAADRLDDAARRVARLTIRAKVSG